MFVNDPKRTLTQFINQENHIQTSYTIILNQQVGGSIPPAGSINSNNYGFIRKPFLFLQTGILSLLRRQFNYHLTFYLCIKLTNQFQQEKIYNLKKVLPVHMFIHQHLINLALFSLAKQLKNDNRIQSSSSRQEQSLRIYHPYNFD